MPDFIRRIAAKGDGMSKLNFNENWQYGHLNEEWRKNITLPHDAMIYEKRTPDSPGGKNTGWYEGYDYVYEKKFAVPEEWKDKNIVFEFESVYRKPQGVYQRSACGAVGIRLHRLLC